MDPRLLFENMTWRIFSGEKRKLGKKDITVPFITTLYKQFEMILIIFQ